MSIYQTTHKLTTNSGNNTFSYDQRRDLLGKAELTVPALKIITSLDEVLLGKHIVFEEVDHTGTLKQCTGLEHLYEYIWNEKTVIIMDNHNHALFFRGRFAIEKDASLPVVHIDQHSDLNEAPQPFDVSQKSDLDYLRHYTNEVCNVGNFIKPALRAGYSSDCIQIRSETALLETTVPTEAYILDIDLDFRDPNMGHTQWDETIEKTKALIKKASLITIATSPYFLDQHVALELLQTLFA